METLMNINICRALAIVAAIGIASAAFAAGLDGLEYQKERIVKLKSAKVVTVRIGKMNGETLAIILMDSPQDGAVEPAMTLVQQRSTSMIGRRTPSARTK
jgi:hypothetical protein